MSRDLTQTLADWLAAGGERIGQIALRRVLNYPPRGLGPKAVDRLEIRP